MPFTTLKCDRTMSAAGDLRDSHSVAVGAAEDHCGSQSGSPSSLRAHINSRLVFGTAGTHHMPNHTHDAAALDGDDHSSTHSDDSPLAELHIPVPTKWQAQPHNEDGAGHLAMYVTLTLIACAREQKSAR